MTTRHKAATGHVALAGILSAVAVMLLFVAGMLPTGWMGATAVAGIAVAVAVSAAGYATGVMCWLASGLLALLLVPAKQVSVLFLCFFGVYPILKNLLERGKLRFLEYLLKLGWFELALLLLYRLCYALFFQPVAEQWTESFSLYTAIAVTGGGIFLLYDYALSKILALLEKRVLNALRRRLGRV